MRFLQERPTATAVPTDTQPLGGGSRAGGVTEGVELFVDGGQLGM